VRVDFRGKVFSCRVRTFPAETVAKQHASAVKVAVHFNNKHVHVAASSNKRGYRPHQALASNRNNTEHKTPKPHKNVTLKYALTIQLIIVLKRSQKKCPP
jgi:hypothetical protein